MDSVTGLYNFRNRDYLPFLGRWMENDPIGFAGGQTNFYAAEGDNPANGSDPTGLEDKPFRLARPSCMMCHGRMDSSGRVDLSGLSLSQRTWVARWLNAQSTDLAELQRRTDRISAFGPTDFFIGAGQGAWHLGTHPWQIVTEPARMGYNAIFNPAQAKEEVSEAGKALILQPSRSAGSMAGSAAVAAPITYGTIRLFGGLRVRWLLKPNGEAAEVVLVSGAAPRAPLAGVLEGHPAGQGFTGVFESSTGRIALNPSTADLVLPPGFVRRAGGHADVSRALGGDAANHSGFAVILQEDGTLRVTWRSGTLNNTPDSLVPVELRPRIIQAIEEQTGRAVSSH